MQVGSVSLLFPISTAKIQPAGSDHTRRQQDIQHTADLTHAAKCEEQRAALTSCELQGFNNPQLAFSAKSTGQLMQSLAIFRACSVKPLVQNADVLLAAAKKIVGPAVVTSVVRHTFFKQFCGGNLHHANRIRQWGYTAPMLQLPLNCCGPAVHLPLHLTTQLLHTMRCANGVP